MHCFHVRPLLFLTASLPAFSFYTLSSITTKVRLEMFQERAACAGLHPFFL
ncbi:hypothetical protein KNP414_04114 [Paenibacillus mucilaginosus KNP414]|uniref:Uncharacterized protein n=1 Tax=Paenibacillus mucilaginosus (strain KNP414) TaxID=1036673 RepID=F8FDT1_PAEMK|nr:hypothetical protein KNP414_04114 [Paenibacillus mucilaginosus KNP414]